MPLVLCSFSLSCEKLPHKGGKLPKVKKKLKKMKKSYIALDSGNLDIWQISCPASSFPLYLF